MLMAHETVHTPFLSILCAAYRAEGTVGRAVHSVLAQTDGDFELLVCDDGSDDGTAEAAARAAAGDGRVTVIRQENAGTGAARNALAALARGEFLCVLDADDEMLPGYLATMREVIGHAPAHDIYACNAWCVDPNGERSLWHVDRDPDLTLQLRLIDMLRSNGIFVMASVRASTFHRAGGFDPAAGAEDYDLWLRILAAGGTHLYTPAVLGVYHRSPGSLSAGASSQWEATAEILREYATDIRLGAGEREVAAASARRYAAMATLARIQETGEDRMTRAQAFASLAAFEAPVKRITGAMLAAVSPRLYARVVAGRRRAELSRRYAETTSVSSDAE